MENKPKQPDEDTPEHSVDPESVPNTTHGIPPDAQSEEPKGLPSSDRHEVETTPAKE